MGFNGLGAGFDHIPLNAAVQRDHFQPGHYFGKLGQMGCNGGALRVGQVQLLDHLAPVRLPDTRLVAPMAAARHHFGVFEHGSKVKQRRELNNARRGTLDGGVSGVVVGIAQGEVEDIALDELQGFPRGVGHHTPQASQQSLL